MRALVFPLLLLLLLLPPALASAGADERLCTPERADAIEKTGVIVRHDDKTIFVTPYIWARLGEDAKRTLTVWAARCLLDTPWIAVKNVHNEQELARWSASIGYTADP